MYLHHNYVRECPYTQYSRTLRDAFQAQSSNINYLGERCLQLMRLDEIYVVMEVTYNEFSI